MSDISGQCSAGISEVGESVTLAEDLGEVSGLALDSKAEFLSLALENSEVWVLRLSWRSSPEDSSNKKSERSKKRPSIGEVSHFATLEGHRSVVTGLHYIGKALS